jgi:hypothetical protein
MSRDNDKKSFTVVQGGKRDAEKSTQRDFSKAVEFDNDPEYKAIRREIDSFFNFEGERFDY